MSIETFANVLNFLGDLDYGVPDEVVASLHLGVESWIKRECRRDFESTTYKEYYDGDDGEILMLKHFPIISITRISMGKRDVISITNTSAYTTAVVSVTTTGLVLVKDGVSNSTITFASNTTMTAIVNAIHALGSNWSAELLSSDYASYASTELMPLYGSSCINSGLAYLSIPEEGLTTFDVYADEGYLVNTSKWTKGNRNIYIEYVAGNSTMPEEIKLAVKILVKHVYQKRMDESWGITSWSMAGISQTFDQIGIPLEANRIINSYRDVYLGG